MKIIMKEDKTGNQYKIDADIYAIKLLKKKLIL